MHSRRDFENDFCLIRFNFVIDPCFSPKRSRIFQQKTTDAHIERPHGRPQPTGCPQWCTSHTGLTATGFPATGHSADHIPHLPLPPTPTTVGPVGPVEKYGVYSGDGGRLGFLWRLSCGLWPCGFLVLGFGPFSRLFLFLTLCFCFSSQKEPWHASASPSRCAAPHDHVV